MSILVRSVFIDIVLLILLALDAAKLIFQPQRMFSTFFRCLAMLKNVTSLLGMPKRGFLNEL